MTIYKYTKALGFCSHGLEATMAKNQTYDLVLCSRMQQPHHLKVTRASSSMLEEDVKCVPSVPEYLVTYMALHLTVATACSCNVSTVVVKLNLYTKKSFSGNTNHHNIHFNTTHQNYNKYDKLNLRYLKF